MIVYYTGTGNSRYAAQALACMLDDTLLDATERIRQKDHTAVHSEKPWVFAAPVYGWRMAGIFADWMEKTEFCGAKDAYFFLTCGSDAGNSSKYLKMLCRKKGLEFRGMQEVVMPENYIAMFKAPGKRASAKIRKTAIPQIGHGAEKILRNEVLEEKKAALGDRIKSSVVNVAFFALFVKSKAFYAKDTCVGCGKCAKSCPVSGIEMREGKPYWTGACTHCMACICGCDLAAIEYGRKSMKKVRYQCPNYREE